jgi:uncharacterized membrane protein YdjX (TVP38/TMEM64 family)
MAMARLQIWTLVVWLVVTLSALSCYLFYPEYFTAEAIRNFLDGSQGMMLLLYLLISLARGIFLIPSTPFILAGAMIFPDLKWTVFWISLAGVMAGASYIYFFTEFLGLDSFFQRKFAKRFEQARKGMDRYGIWIVILWSFFPVVPTDLISYTAGVTRMPYWKFALGVLIGEIPLVAIYVFTGMALGDWLWL